MTSRMYDIEEAPGSSNGSVVAEVMTSGAAVQQVRSSFATAVSVQKPRKIADIRLRIIEEANLAGEDFYYGWGAGDVAIEGPSVKLATALARCWGNCAVEMGSIQDMPDSWIMTASFIDLETGFTLDRQFRQAKDWTVYGKMDAARKQDIRFQIGQSKAVRNVILNAMPSSLVDIAMEHAKEGVRKRIQAFVNQNGVAKAVDMLLAAFAKAGVSEERVLARAGVASKQAIAVDQIVSLRGDLTAIENGQERAADMFPDKSGGGKTADVEKAIDAKKTDADNSSQGQTQEPATPTGDAPAKRGRKPKNDAAANDGQTQPATEASKETPREDPKEGWTKLATGETLAKIQDAMEKLGSDARNEFDFIVESMQLANLGDATRAQADKLLAWLGRQRQPGAEG